MRKRIFIVAPTSYGQSLGDSRHDVCESRQAGSVFELYMDGKFNIVGYRQSLASAKAFAMKLGAKRPKVVA